MTIADVQSSIEPIGRIVNGAGPTNANGLSPAAAPIAHLVSALAARGAVVRLATGIATLDDDMRGGIPAVRLVVVGGAPGAGKTSVTVRLGYEWAKAGIPVAVIAADEGPDGVVARIALYVGCKIALLDDGNADEWARLETAVRDLPLYVADSEQTIESVAAHLRKVAGEAPAVLVVDSIQTARCEGDAPDATRERVDGVVRSLKLARDVHRLLVVATCELARGYYRNPTTAKELNPLAAFKESGAIEYASQTAFVLTTPRGQDDAIDVVVAKNRGYPRRDFRLRLHDDLSFHETDKPAALAEAASDDKPDPIHGDVERVRRTLAEVPGVRGKSALRATVRAQTGPLGDARVDAALAFLEARGEVANRGTPSRPAYFLASVADAQEAP